MFFWLTRCNYHARELVMSEKDVYTEEPGMRHFTLLHATFLKGMAYKKKLHEVN